MASDPTPVAGDHERAAQLVDELFGDHLSSTALADDPEWDTYAVVAVADDQTIRVAGFTYATGQPGRRTAIGTVGETSGYRQLRTATTAPDGSQWAAAVFVLDRDRASGAVRYLYGDEADRFAGEALFDDDAIEHARPRPDDFR